MCSAGYGVDDVHCALHIVQDAEKHDANSWQFCFQLLGPTLWLGGSLLTNPQGGRKYSQEDDDLRRC